jgi:glycosyltransferase involved in cell wall biosynthesis
LTKLSVSTKISEYLASGTCIIGYGPAEVASMRILSDNKIGLTITDIDNDDEKIEKLKKILSNSNMRNEFAQNGFDYAFNNFNAEKSRSYLKNILCAR